MEEGFIVDVSQANQLQSQWVQGKPEKSFWTGIKTKGRSRRLVTTFRCVRCGFLESYATEEMK
jgi:hypothetical protein